MVIYDLEDQDIQSTLCSSIRSTENRQVPDIVPVNSGDDVKVFY